MLIKWSVTKITENIHVVTINLFYDFHFMGTISAIKDQTY